MESALNALKEATGMVLASATEKLTLTADVYGKHGFAFSFPYPGHNPRLLTDLKLDLPGVRWDKSRKQWVSDGPEVMLDCRRGGYKLQYTSKALERAVHFRVFIDDLIETRYQQPENTPYAFQEIGAQTLIKQKRGILADGMGLGKTRQAILAALRVMGNGPVLVVAPKTLTFNWMPEVIKWSAAEGVDVSAAVVPDTAAKRKTFWADWDGTGFVIANYEKLNSADWPSNIPWNVIIGDEATYIKTGTAQRTKSFWKVANKVEYVWLLSGTPFEIRVQELYQLMCKLRPSVFGSYSRFRDIHLITDHFGEVIGVQNRTLLSERVAPWMLRRTKADVNLQIPPKIYNDVLIELAGDERSTYIELRDKFTSWIREQGRDLNEANALTQLLRLQQYTSDPRLVDEHVSGSKIQALKGLVDEWDGQVLVFTRFKTMIPLIMDSLGMHPEAVISGDVTKGEDRVSRVDRFNRGELGRVMIMTDAGAYGLNVTSADLIVQYDFLWNPGKMEQREDRLHRIGQVKTVNVVRLICRETVDEGMVHVLTERKELFDEVMDGAETAVMNRLNLTKIAAGER